VSVPRAGANRSMGGALAGRPEGVSDLYGEVCTPCAGTVDWEFVGVCRAHMRVLPDILSGLDCIEPAQLSSEHRIAPKPTGR
jgi:hypothetical protein